MNPKTLSWIAQSLDRLAKAAIVANELKLATAGSGHGWPDAIDAQTKELHFQLLSQATYQRPSREEA